MSYTVRTWVYINTATDDYECIVMGHDVRDDGTHEIWRTRTDLMSLVVTEFPTYGSEYREGADEVYAEGEVGYAFWSDERNHKGWLDGGEFSVRYRYVSAYDILRGFMCGLVRLDTDDDGLVVCRIGQNWFHFISDGFEGSPFEYASRTPTGDIIASIVDAVNEFCDPPCMTEWLYYRYVLNND